MATAGAGCGGAGSARDLGAIRGSRRRRRVGPAATARDRQRDVRRPRHALEQLPRDRAGGVARDPRRSRVGAGPRSRNPLLLNPAPCGLPPSGRVAGDPDSPGRADLLDLAGFRPAAEARDHRVGHVLSGRRHDDGGAGDGRSGDAQAATDLRRLTRSGVPPGRAAGGAPRAVYRRQAGGRVLGYPRGVRRAVGIQLGSRLPVHDRRLAVPRGRGVRGRRDPLDLRDRAVRDHRRRGATVAPLGLSITERIRQRMSLRRRALGLMTAGPAAAALPRCGGGPHPRALGRRTAGEGAAATAGCGEVSNTLRPPAGTANNLSVELDYFPNADHVGIYEAEALGYFKQADLNVHLHAPTNAATPLQLLESGKVDVAISYEPDVLLARNQNIPLVSVAAIVQRPLTSIVSVGSQNITAPKDLRGKTIGTSGIPYQSAFLQTILHHAHVPASSVKEVDVGEGLVPAMVSGRVNATLGAYWNYEAIQLSQLHKDPNVIHMDQAGVPTYDELVFVVRKATIVNHAPLIRRFVQAVARGYKGARAA